MAKEYGLAESALAGKPKAEKKPAKKTIREVRHRATKNGGYIVEHHHHDSAHPMEEHSVAGPEELAAHLGTNSPQASPEGAPEAEAAPAPQA
jgi:hypothetical protein